MPLLNILMVTLGFYPATAWGGPVKIVHQNSRELVRRGHQVTVYCSNLMDKHRKIAPGTFEREVDGIRVVYFDTWHLPWWPGTLGPIVIPNFRSQVKGDLANFDIVHLNGYRNPMNLQITAAASRASLPLVMQPHGALQVIVNSQGLKHLYDWLLGRRELNHLSALVALQSAERNQALRYGIPSDIIHIIPNGLDLTDRAKIPTQGTFRKRINVSEHQPLILFLGRINRKKGTDMLVEAFSMLHLKDAYLVIAGPDDGQLEEVKQLIQRYQLQDRVILPGLLNEQDAMSAFQDADLFVLPCRTDTFPTTIMEACLAGTPMVITKGCEIADMIDGQVGDVTGFDAAEYSAAIERLLSDRERYQRYKLNCERMMRESFSIESVIDRLEILYQRLLQQKSVKGYARGAI